MFAAKDNHLRVVKVLLGNGANLSVVADERCTALLIAAQYGHVAVAKLLVEAGANIEERDDDGQTPLHLSSHRGYSEVMKVLLEAGARVDSRLPDGATPLYLACERGRRQAVRLLFEAGTNPLLAPAGPRGVRFLPLDMASQNGHIDTVRDFLERFGIKGCGGPSGGVDALHYAAQDQHLDVMELLTEVGVVDTGMGLIAAIGYGRVGSVRFLLRQRKLRQRNRGDDVRAYVNDSRDAQGRTPVYRCVLECPQAAPRIIQGLVEVGADVASPVPVPVPDEDVLTLYTPLGVANILKEREEDRGEAKSEKKLNTLEAICRLLTRVEAVRATSWLWARGFPMTGWAESTEKAPTALASMLPVMRRRAARRGVVLPTLFRWAMLLLEPEYPCR